MSDDVLAPPEEEEDVSQSDLRIEVTSVYDNDGDPYHTYRLYDGTKLVYTSPWDYSSHKEARQAGRQQRNWLRKRRQSAS